MAIPAKAFATDWVTILVNVGIILVAPVTVFFFLPFYRRLQVTTIYEYLELRFSAGLRVYGSLAFVTYQLGKMGVFLLLPALALATVTGFNVYLCIAVMGVLCIIYTVMGGIEAVVWTDVIQSLVLIGGALLCVGIVFRGENFDISKMAGMAVSDEVNKLYIGYPGTLVFWQFLVGGFFIQLVPFTSDQALAQRFLTTATEKSAARSVWAHAAMVVPSSLLFFGLGTALYIFYVVRPEQLPPSDQDDIIVPWFIATQLPAGLAGLVIAGLFAATMSSVDSGMHSIATTLVNDIYQKFHHDATDARQLSVARWLTVGVGLCGTLSAVLVTSLDPKSLWDLILLLVGLLGSTLTGVFLLGVLSRRANTLGTVFGIVASMLTLVTIRVLPQNPVPGILTSAVGVTTCVLVGYVASLFSTSSSQELTNLTVFTLDKNERTVQ
jgi:SSS family transporter